MKASPTLREYGEDIYHCVRCGLCRFVCPILSQRDMEETLSPRGRMLLIRGLVKEELKASARIAEKLYQCTLCRQCYIKCPPGLEVDKIIKAARHELVKAGVAPLDAHSDALVSLKTDSNPLGMPKVERGSWLSESGIHMPRQVDVLYWAGCVSSYLNKSIAKSTLRIFEEVGINIKTLGSDEGCCGLPYTCIGAWDLFEDVVKTNVERIKDAGVKILVTSCAGCYSTFKQEYSQIYGSLPFEVLHVSQFLGELLDKGKLNLRKEVKARVTYHDPCHLGRHAGIYVPPREIIKAVPGVEYVEMRRSRVDSRCCGAGGAVRLAFPSLSTDMAVTRITQDVVAVKPDILVTACPTCVLNLRDGVTIAKALYDVEGFETLDLVELVCRALP